ncbi:hypothetical protein GJAV_G00192050 [Gymnothorax javanicus]|nr:hypothetical protein GJAV_G00192050 [Gymnothorax javanicus]
MATIISIRRRQRAADYDEKADQRVVKHVCLRNRNNSTSCRSPGRQNEADRQKTELQNKRQLEFLRRRKIDDTETLSVPQEAKRQEKGSEKVKVTLRTNPRRPPQLNRRSIVRAEDLGIIWPDASSVDQWMTPLTSQGSMKKTGCQEANDPILLSTNPTLSDSASLLDFQSPSSINTTPLCVNPLQSPYIFTSLPTNRVPLSTNPITLSSNPVTLSTNPTPLFTNPVQSSVNSVSLSNPTPTTYLLSRGTSNRQMKDRGVQTASCPQTQTISTQTESGLITIKESDLQQLAHYLQESIRREECLKKKLALLQCHASSLLQSSDKLWISRCDEDLLKSQISVLESQLHICKQKLSRDGVKKLVLQMEEQRRGYEQKAMAALQKAMEEKAEAEGRAESLQVAMQAMKEESAQWQSLYEELKKSCGQLRSNQQRTADLLQQQHNQLEAAAGQEAKLTKQLAALQHESLELHARIAFLEEENRVKTAQLLEMRDLNHETLGITAQPHLFDGRLGTDPLSQNGVQLYETLERLGMKEKECVELRAELEAMEHECHTCQSRLAQCREELRQLSGRRSKRRCSCWLGVVLLLVLVVLAVALICLYHPTISVSLQDLYRALQRGIEQYLRDMASPEHSGCYRPI